MIFGHKTYGTMKSNTSLAFMVFLISLVGHASGFDSDSKRDICVKDTNNFSSLIFSRNSKASLEVETFSIISSLREKIANEGYAYIGASLFRRLLLYFGAEESQLVAIEQGSIHSQIKPLASEPKLFFRGSGSHNVLLDDTKDYINDPYITTDYPCVTITPKSEISSDSKANIKMERSGARVWNLSPKEYHGSSVSLAMAKLHKLFLPKTQRPQSHMNMLSNITVNTQDFFRVNKHLSEFAEPSSEGIHQDGFEITSVTLIRRQNIRNGGETRIWNLQQPIGYYPNAEFGSDSNTTSVPNIKGFKWSNILFRKTMMQPWETIVINDRAVKHESRAFYMNEKGKPSYRDVMINNLRKPFLGGIDKMRIDGKVVDVL